MPASKGYWQCYSCNYRYNWTSKTACWKCGKPKAARGDDQRGGGRDGGAKQWLSPGLSAVYKSLPDEAWLAIKQELPSYQVKHVETLRGKAQLLAAAGITQHSDVDQQSFADKRKLYDQYAKMLRATPEGEVKDMLAKS